MIRIILTTFIFVSASGCDNSTEPNAPRNLPQSMPNALPAQATADDSREDELNNRAPFRVSEIHKWVRDYSIEEAKAKIKATPKCLSVSDSRGLTALHWASRLGRDEIVRVLLDFGADPNAKSTKGRYSNETPLAFLLDDLHRPLDSNASPNEVAEVRQSMARGFMMSDRQLPAEYERIVESLIAKGADINARDASGRTPIMKAVIGGHRSIIEILLEHSADLSATTRFGESVFDICNNSGSPESICNQLNDSRNRALSRSPEKESKGDK